MKNAKLKLAKALVVSTVRDAQRAHRKADAEAQARAQDLEIARREASNATRAVGAAADDVENIEKIAEALS